MLIQEAVVEVNESFLELLGAQGAQHVRMQAAEQGSRLKLHGHVLQEGHEVGRAPLHLIQVLELVVLFLGIRLQLNLKILVLCPDDADGHQAGSGGPWGRPSGDVFCLHGHCRAGVRAGW